MYLRKAYLILAVLCFCGCSSHSEYHESVFPETGEAEISFIGSPIFGSNAIFDLCQEGDYLFVLMAGSGCWLHIFNKFTGEEVSATLREGRGPREILIVGNMDYLPRERNLYCFDPMLQKTIVLHLDGESGTAEFVKEIHHPDGILNMCYILPDGRYLYQGFLAEYGDKVRYTLSDGNIVLDTYNTYSGVDIRDENAFNDYLQALACGAARVDPETGFFVSGTGIGQVLECFTISQDRIIPAGIRLFNRPMLDRNTPYFWPAKGVKWGFFSFCLKDGLIYSVLKNSTDLNEKCHIASFTREGKECVLYHTSTGVNRICPSYDRNSDLYGVVNTPDGEYFLAKVKLRTN